MRYLHSMIRVADLEKSLDFYCNKLGMIEAKRQENAEHRYTLVFLSAPGDLSTAEENKTPLLELTYNWPTEDQPVVSYSQGRNFGHLAYRVEHIYQFCQRLLDQGVAILRPPRDGRMAFIRCPDNISIELLQQGDALPPEEPWLSMPNQGAW